VEASYDHVGTVFISLVHKRFFCFDMYTIEQTYKVAMTVWMQCWWYMLYL